MRLKDYFAHGDTTGFNVVEQSDGAATVECQHCGHQQTEIKSFAVAAEEITCENCGRQKRFDNHLGLAMVVIVAVLLWARVRSLYHRARGSIPL